MFNPQLEITQVGNSSVYASKTEGFNHTSNNETVKDRLGISHRYGGEIGETRGRRSDSIRMNSRI